MVTRPAEGLLLDLAICARTGGLREHSHTVTIIFRVGESREKL